ncbi:MAG: helix-turn-helix domain-containing protein, partial [Coriobacteriales bacterium]|nr:helix-turn-helix domain-containing protein [Coriobacteriales bacterium]
MSSSSFSDARLVDVPLGAVLDLVAPRDVLYQPGDTERCFCWPILISGGEGRHKDAREGVEQGALGAGQGFELGALGAGRAAPLFVTDADRAPALMSEDLGAFCLVIQEDRALPSWLSRFSDRVCLLRSDEGLSLCFARVQALFAGVLLWYAAMERVVLTGGGLQQLFDEAAAFLKGFVYVYDQAGSLVAHHGSPLLLEADCAEMLGSGVLGPELLVDGERLDLEAAPTARTRVWIDRPRPGLSNARLLCRVKAQGTGEPYNLVLLVAPGRLSAGLCSLFSLFAEAVQCCCPRRQRGTSSVGQAHFALFEKLLDDEQVSASYIEAQAERLALPLDAEFKLLQTGPLPSEDRLAAASVSEALGRLNGGDGLVFFHRGGLLTLCYCERNDNRLSTRRIEDSVRRQVFEPCQLTTSASQVFSHLKDLGLAYRQTVIAREFRETIDAERPQGAEPCALYPFEDAFLFYLISQRELDTRFLAFSFSHTILEKIHSEDVQNGTDDVSLLWAYLYYERKVSSVAECMHMHRNTVLYRIGRIMKRFDLDFSEQGIRD